MATTSVDPPSFTSEKVVSKTIRVCVLTPSYEDSDSATKEWDSIVATPKHFFPEGFVETSTAYVTTAGNSQAGSLSTTGSNTPTPTPPPQQNNNNNELSTTTKITTNTSYTFGYVELKKATAYRDLRSIIKSNSYDCFFNLCDGAKDEDRAGEEVVRTLEEFRVPFTGSVSKYFELSKPDMKMMAHYCGVPTARHAVLDAGDLLATEVYGDNNNNNNNNNAPLRLEAKCAHLRFPVIVKHVSGYASIGMTQANKCLDMAALKERAAIFINEFDFALVEEFIVGDEATVLACADNSCPDGIRVFHPVMVNFPEGNDFKHFDLKWTAFEGMEWRSVPQDDPSLTQIFEIGRKSFKEMMGGVGYGRCDLRINRERNEVVFLEINPNCGIMYPPGQEGSADYILQLCGEKNQRDHNNKNNNNDSDVDKFKGQRDFAILQIKTAIARCEREKPLWYRSFDSERDFHLRASRDISKGTVVFNDEGRAVRLFTKPFVDAHWSEEDKVMFRDNAWPIGGGPASDNNNNNNNNNHHYFAVWDVNPATWRTFNHSDADSANLIFGPNRSLNVVAARNIKKGEELTMNYELLKCENMPQPKKGCGEQ